MKALDYKKMYKDLYLPGTEPEIVNVPSMTFIMVDGKGDPNEPEGEYQRAAGVLYALAYTIKMGFKSADGYFAYVVPPLEGLWWFDDGGPFRFGEKHRFCWISMIRQPEFGTLEIFDAAVRQAAAKKPGLDFGLARLAAFEEGLCVQCMHLGPYESEPGTVAKMDAHAAGQGYAIDMNDARHHHEIYLSDPRKTEPAKIKTVLRHPVRKI